MAPHGDVRLAPQQQSKIKLPARSEKCPSRHFALRKIDQQLPALRQSRRSRPPSYFFVETRRPSNATLYLSVKTTGPETGSVTQISGAGVAVVKKNFSHSMIAEDCRK
jgi:hypothetical protein